MRPSILTATALALALALAGALPAHAADPPRVIAVSGMGEATTPADLATVSFGVTNVEDEAGAALRANSAAMQKVFDLMKEAGIPLSDVQTSQFSLNPVWQQNEDGMAQEIAGYQVYNLVSVRLRQVDAVGALLDRLTQQGVNQINGISFEVADPAAAKDEARRAAMRDALARARLYAEAAGVKLGKVLTITEGGDFAQPVVLHRYAAEAAVAPAPIAAGESRITASVSVTFEIE